MKIKKAWASSRSHVFVDPLCESFNLKGIDHLLALQLVALGCNRQHAEAAHLAANTEIDAENAVRK
ncbi:MAG: hypothetical protein WCK17_16630 [Verrucomicrobiota bacterium]